MSELRRSGRAVVVDDDGRVLLLHGRTQEDGARLAWYLSGGRLEDGETYEQATVRELAEELGLVDVTLGPWVWTRHATRRHDSGTVATESRFYLVRTASFVPTTEEIGGSEAGVDWRWWTLDELDGDNESTFIPARLPALIRDLLAGNLPSMPVDVSDPRVVPARVQGD